MKFIFLVALLATSTFALSACKTTADTRNDRYSIDLSNDRDRYDGGYKHCPPGHAKKGWC
jgi:hypothetical protein